MGCGCGGSSSSMGAIAGMADPLDMLTMGGVDAGQCDGVAIVLSASKVEAFRRFLAPSFDATNRAALGCAGLAPEELAAWNTFFASWKTVEKADSSFFGASADWNVTCGFARTLDAWRDRLKESCRVPGPEVTAPPPPEAPSVVKWVVVGVVAVSAVALLLSTGVGPAIGKALR